MYEDEQVQSINCETLVDVNSLSSLSFVTSQIKDCNVNTTVDIIQHSVHFHLFVQILSKIVVTKDRVVGLDTYR